MRIGVFGKGGVGKTTTAGILARELARRGHRVTALDCDANPTLGLALGVSPSETERLAGLRQAVADGEAEHAPTIAEMLERFGTDAPGGIRLAVINKIDQPEPG